jgi:hypothetical protein
VAQRQTRRWSSREKLSSDRALIARRPKADAAIQES